MSDEKQEGATKGPWVLDERAEMMGRVYSDDATGSIICQCDGFKYAPRTRAEIEANARLISAAPDLLAACRALLPEGWGDDDTMDHMPGVKLARAAITKATIGAAVKKG